MDIHFLSKKPGLGPALIKTFHCLFSLQCDSACAITLTMKDDLLSNPANVSFKDLVSLCNHYFGEPRIRGSHFIFKTPWKGDPRINLQKSGKMAKPYQLRDVKKAIEKLEAQHGK
jgi:hypothetical protein